ncbi:MAG: flagellar basal-body MS-ring/collar protein FliF [Verrucomicrobiota bacterium]
MNNGLSQIGSQLQNIWKQLGGGQRLTIVVTALAVILGLSGLVFWSARPDYALLYGRLDDAEAAKVIAALGESNVPYQTSRGGGAIMVPSDKVHQVRMQLAAKGIPRGEGVGFEIFDKPNFGISDFVQRANYLRAVQGELSRTIAQVDIIESARVMIVMPENRLLVDNQKKPTASVFVRVRGNTPLPPQNVNAIRFLVANSVEGLTANNVSVVDNQGNVLSENNDNDTVAGLSSTQLSARQNLEKYLAKKAEEMLNKVLGAGQSVVRVSADINFDSLSRVEEKFDPEGQIPRTTTLTEEKMDSITASPSGGAPGVSANSSTETNSPGGLPANSSKTNKKVSNTSYEINKTVSNIMQTPGSVKRVSAAVFVAANSTGSGTNRVVNNRTPEEMQKIKRVVMGALGIQEGPDATRPDQITIEEMPFNEEPALEITKQFEQQQKKEFWWDLAKTAVYPLLGCAVLFIFWRTFKSTPVDHIPLGVPVGSVGGNGRGLRPGDSDAVTVEVLNQLIRENPHNMTHAIRSWMGKPKEK